MAAHRGYGGHNSIGSGQGVPFTDWIGASWRGRSVGPDGGSAGWLPPSGRKWQGAQSCQGATELGFPGPTLGKMQSEAARRAGEPSGQGEEASPEGLGGHHLLTQTDARCPASQVVGHHLDRQPGGVGGEAARLRDRRSLGILENPREGGFT